MNETLKAPFPYFGGKASVAGPVWARLGSDCRSYVEPFCGSMAMLLFQSAPGDEAGGNERIWFSPHCLRPATEATKTNGTHAQLAMAWTA